MFKTDVVFDLIAEALGAESNKKELHAMLELYALAYMADLEATEDLSAARAVGADAPAACEDCGADSIQRMQKKLDFALMERDIFQNQVRLMDKYANGMLTLSQLRGMEGEPVWVVDLMNANCSGYYFVQRLEGKLALIEARDCPDGGKDVPYYGLGAHNGHDAMWVAYRRRPEEAKCDA